MGREWKERRRSSRGPRHEPLERLSPEDFFTHYRRLYEHCVGEGLMSLGAIRNHPNLSGELERLELQFMVFARVEQKLILDMLSRQRTAEADTDDRPLELFENFEEIGRTGFSERADYVGKTPAQLSGAHISI